MIKIKCDSCKKIKELDISHRSETTPKNLDGWTISLSSAGSVHCNDCSETIIAEHNFYDTTT